MFLRRGLPVNRTLLVRQTLRSLNLYRPRYSLLGRSSRRCGLGEKLKKMTATIGVCGILSFNFINDYLVRGLNHPKDYGYIEERIIIPMVSRAIDKDVNEILLERAVNTQIKMELFIDEKLIELEDLENKKHSKDYEEQKTNILRDIQAAIIKRDQAYLDTIINNPESPRDLVEKAKKARNELEAQYARISDSYFIEDVSTLLDLMCMATPTGQELKPLEAIVSKETIKISQTIIDSLLQSKGLAFIAALTPEQKAIAAGRKIALQKLLKNYEEEIVKIGGKELIIDKKGIIHAFERHHPEYWNFTAKTTQTFFHNDMTLKEATSIVKQITKQNEEIIKNNESSFVRVIGKYKGEYYVVGYKEGRLRQFFKVDEKLVEEYKKILKEQR